MLVEQNWILLENGTGTKEPREQSCVSSAVLVVLEKKAKTFTSLWRRKSQFTVRQHSKNSKKCNFTGLEIATNTVTNATNIFSLATKNSGLVATLVTRSLCDLD